MLPNKMKISEKSFNALRRLQNNTGLTVNVGARLAFFVSVERGFTYNNDDVELKHRELDKHTWLGDHSKFVELLLKQKYPDLEAIELYKAWAGHVEDGSTVLETKQSLHELVLLTVRD